MAQLITVSVYGKNGLAVGTSAGLPHAFPTSAIVVEPAGSGVTFNGVTMQSAIKILPDAAYRQVDTYYTAATVSTIVTAANAALA